MALNGFAGSCASTTEAQKVIAALDKYADHGLTTYRWTCNPSWWGSGGTRPFNPTNIQYFLDHCNYTLILCRNHLWSSDGVNHLTEAEWAQAEADILNTVLNRWGNNPRVVVEIVNEENNSASIYNPHIQTIVTSIRSHGFTNWILQNNQYQSTWVKFIDPLNKTIQGHHCYMNELTSGTGTVVRHAEIMQKAWAAGATYLTNTETGANSSEQAYTSQNITDLTSWLNWCKVNSVGSCIWLNHHTENLATYEALGLDTWLPYYTPTIHNLTLQSNPPITWNVGGTPLQNGIHPYPKGTILNIASPAEVG